MKLFSLEVVKNCVFKCKSLKTLNFVASDKRDFNLEVVQIIVLRRKCKIKDRSNTFITMMIWISKISLT